MKLTNFPLPLKIGELFKMLGEVFFRLSLKPVP